MDLKVLVIGKSGVGRFMMEPHLLTPTFRENKHYKEIHRGTVLGLSKNDNRRFVANNETEA